MNAERPAEQAYGLLDASSGTYGTRASRAYWIAIGGSIAVVVLLLGGFAYFFRRSVRVTREQARTLRKLELAQAERAKLLERTVQVAEHERIRVAMDLHDGPIQALTAIAFKLDLLVMRMERGDLEAVPPAVEEVRSSLSAEMVSLRRLMVELRPPILDERGLAAALRDSAAEVLDGSEIAWEVHADVEETRFRPELETVVYRVAREALLNARKHSRAERLWVLLEHRDDGLHLEVVDDGVGFDEEAEEPAIGGGRYGLLGMKERVESVGGTWAVHTAPGAGTRCEATLPWQERTEPSGQTRAGHASV
jgi:signal transduction histidine kinase